MNWIMLIGGGALVGIIAASIFVLIYWSIGSGKDE